MQAVASQLLALGREPLKRAGLMPAPALHPSAAPPIPDRPGPPGVDSGRTAGIDEVRSWYSLRTRSSEVSPTTLVIRIRATPRIYAFIAAYLFKACQARAPRRAGSGCAALASRPRRSERRPPAGAQGAPAQSPPPRAGLRRAAGPVPLPPRPGLNPSCLRRRRGAA